MSLKITEETTFLLNMVNSSALEILEDGNTVAWFDMAATYITGDPVSQWDDRSGNNNHLKQAVGTAQPSYSASGLLFDGVAEYMKCDAFTLVQPTNIYVVLKHITWTENDVIFDGHTTTSNECKQGGVTPTVRVSAGTISEISGFTLDTFGIIQILYNGTSSKRKLNDDNNTLINLGTNNAGGFTLGSRGAGNTAWSHIEVKEVIIRRTADSSTNDTVIYNYLVDKYSL